MIKRYFISAPDETCQEWCKASDVTELERQLEQAKLVYLGGLSTSYILPKTNGTFIVGRGYWTLDGRAVRCEAFVDDIVEFSLADGKRIFTQGNGVEINGKYDDDVAPNPAGYENLKLIRSNLIP